MKKTGILVLALILAVCTGLLLGRPREHLPLPVSAGEVDSITIYSFGHQAKKEVSAREDIDFVQDAMAGAWSKGPYDRQHMQAMLGDRHYSILFHLSNGESLPCVFSPMAEEAGYYSDGNTRVLVRGLPVSALWEDLKVPAVPASADQEFSSWPTL